ncbi:MAG: inorganic pyrophosphatase [Gammaproteobacteria bacterium RIFCSPLOWO2_02_FULL_42_14]|nr:MAG: inorganic pyrophosphatase [Gammaproteobacteria bacterium RIFCSPHIGHO2_02_FULL_42_43]OGT27438.1 MAG: inorganic pyrophosphatase [Gammaproteobacteria bacterium RIFCSPHIGHO2_01_FULL_42_8]OGT52423.1 MAG: inorganic pyrophosphatase [Gammaproteobacteria bacterium RIFCSPHIGHO2_12_FULL_41_25]OGT63361.1 MAG: inorganic pyrophosphatase [Gammaproteobacteria bacterium RIFCSPLOWO2_02_FULL_42_14]OGT86446.1 MAG: inorganic pyrophosphatase [Gammaproteobacteria bacterium RIFCSPLOWO2_12_FULL_42_18]
MILNNITPGRSIPNDVNVIIEISANCTPIKYEIDKASGLLMVDRFMPTAMHYPCNYGFVPNTLSLDGDPVDVLVITPYPVQAGSFMRCRALGVLQMTDESGEDCKVLALPIEKACIHYAHMKTLKDIPEVMLNSITHFFEHYKKLEPNKWVKIGEWLGVDAATKEINDSIQRAKK